LTFQVKSPNQGLSILASWFSDLKHVEPSIISFQAFHKFWLDMLILGFLDELELGILFWASSLGKFFVLVTH